MESTHGGLRRWVSRAAGWSWLTLPLLLLLQAAITVLTMSTNEYAGDFFGPYDPQLDEQRIEVLRHKAVQLYTAGHTTGQLVSAILGVVVLRARGRYGPTALAMAAFLGITVAAFTEAVAAPLAEDRLRRTGAFLGLAVQTDPGVERVVLISLVGFPLWAMIGVAVGALSRWDAATVLPLAAFHLTSAVGWYLSFVFPPLFFLMMHLPMSSHGLTVANLLEPVSRSMTRLSWLPLVLLPAFAIHVNLVAAIVNRRHQKR